MKSRTLYSVSDGIAAVAGPGLWPSTLLFALLLGLSACSGASRPPGGSATPTDYPVGASAPVLPGDQLAIRIWREPELSGTFHVGHDGRVVLPRLGVVQVAGAEAGQLRDSLYQAYSAYLRTPSVEVSLLRRVGVQGEVRKPDLYQVDLTMTLRDIIAQAGGITDTGNPDRIFIVRGGEEIAVKGDAARFLAAELRSGDQIVVGRRSWFELNSLAIASTGAVVVSVMFPLLRSLLQ